MPRRARQKRATCWATPGGGALCLIAGDRIQTQRSPSLQRTRGSRRGSGIVSAMKQNGIIAIVFIVGCATGGVAAQLVVPPVRAGTSPTRWEYQCTIADSNDGEVVPALNQLGAEGWELVNTAPHATGGYVRSYMLCAKRALP